MRVWVTAEQRQWDKRMRICPCAMGCSLFNDRRFIGFGIFWNRKNWLRRCACNVMSLGEWFYCHTFWMEWGTYTAFDYYYQRNWIRAPWNQSSCVTKANVVASGNAKTMAIVKDEKCQSEVAEHKKVFPSFLTAQSFSATSKVCIFALIKRK